MPEPSKPASSRRDTADDAEARRWARETREALEAGMVRDDSEQLRSRLREERSKQQTQQ